MSVMICRVYKVVEGEDPFTATEAVDPMYLVEITGTTTPTRNAGVVGNEMSEFAEQLRPHVHMQLFLEETFRL
jgi:hypothetical protein